MASSVFQTIPEKIAELKAKLHFEEEPANSLLPKEILKRLDDLPEVIEEVRNALEETEQGVYDRMNLLYSSYDLSRCQKALMFVTNRNLLEHFILDFNRMIEMHEKYHRAEIGLDSTAKELIDTVKDPMLRHVKRKSYHFECVKENPEGEDAARNIYDIVESLTKYMGAIYKVVKVENAPIVMKGSEMPEDEKAAFQRQPSVGKYVPIETLEAMEKRLNELIAYWKWVIPERQFDFAETVLVVYTYLAKIKEKIDKEELKTAQLEIKIDESYLETPRTPKSKSQVSALSQLLHSEEHSKSHSNVSSPSLSPRTSSEPRKSDEEWSLQFEEEDDWDLNGSESEEEQGSPADEFSSQTKVNSSTRFFEESSRRKKSDSDLGNKDSNHSESDLGPVSQPIPIPQRNTKK